MLFQEYSANNITHYDHNLIHWGVCVTKTCRQYLGNHTVHEALEACLNSSLQQTHQLQARLVEDQVYCTEFGETIPLDTGDIIVATVLITILALNLLGSLYDFCFVPEKSVVGKVLLCFSVKRNWKRLSSPSGEGPEPRLRRLKMFNGVKSFTTFLVVMGHSPMAALITSNNTHFIELTYYNAIYHIFHNGNLIVQSFFMTSGFLLAFNLLVVEEKVKLTWNKFPKWTMLRWMRLTPPYAVVLAVVATWMRRFGNGPMWQTAVGVEVDACRRDWYYHLLYVNDYVDYSQCMSHTWYLAADFQLTILGLLLFCCLRSWRARKIAIAVTFAVGVVTPAAHTYFQNLSPILILAPEVARHYFVEDPTFNNLYKRGHTNVVCYAMGLALGMWVYKLMNTNFDVTKYKKYRIVYWSTFPAGVLLIICGGVFYIDGIQIPLAVRVAYAPIVKILFGMIGFILTLGTIFKLETVYRGLLEWRGWAVFGRISYCAYLVHVSVIRYSAANHTSLLHSNFFQIVSHLQAEVHTNAALLTYFGLLLTTFVVAFPCWMMVEAPFNQLVKVCFYPAPKTRKEDKETELIGTAHVVLMNNK
ncbi:nose resistant to fluoxetine protein 6-like [Cydia splendana]|uniref:nose resistant to fluoxetine protein 6-like n=1 Tax=Cydia splendana TaxID=1100963 RepID=UPI00300C4FC7